jgi:phage tail-like protein
MIASRDARSELVRYDEAYEPPEVLAKYLPGIYQEDAFTRQFLRIFDELFLTVEDHASALPDQFSPHTAAPEMLDLLASWLLDRDMRTLPSQLLRRLLPSYARLCRLRGTAEGIQLLLDVALGPGNGRLTRGAPGFTLGPSAQLGSGMTLGRAGEGPVPIDVTVSNYPPGIDTSILNMLIRAYKPAGLAHRVSAVSEGSHGDAALSVPAAD